MIQNWQETPAHGNRISAALCLCFGIGGVIVFYAAENMPYPAFWQTGGVAFFTAAVYFCARWLIRYTYRIEEDDRDPRFGMDLTVSRRTGQKTVTDCRLGLGDLQGLDVETPRNRKALRAKYRDIRVHSYCPDVLPARAVWLDFDDGGNRVVVRLQPGDDLLAMLKEALDNHR